MEQRQENNLGELTELWKLLDCLSYNPQESTFEEHFELVQELALKMATLDKNVEPNDSFIRTYLLKSLKSSGIPIVLYICGLVQQNDEPLSSLFRRMKEYSVMASHSAKLWEQVGVKKENDEKKTTTTSNAVQETAVEENLGFALLAQLQGAQLSDGQKVDFSGGCIQN